MERRVLDEAAALIRPAHSPLLVCHLDPDGDAIGSLVGLGTALDRMGQRPILACPDPVPANLGFIPGVGRVVQETAVSFDLIIALDCSDEERLGPFAQTPSPDSVPVLNVDHHATNLGFGSVNLVDPGASSTAEIILALLDHLGLPVDADVATALLAGLVADTRGFRTSNVTVRVMQAAQRLMEAGASLHEVTYHALDRRPIAAMRLWGMALARIEITDRVIWTSVPLEMRQAAGSNAGDESGLTNFLIGAQDADVAALFVEHQDGSVEVGLRAVPGLDVARVALGFGGGGHALAAGCTIPGPLEEARTRVLGALQAEVSHRQNN